MTALLSGRPKANINKFRDAQFKWKKSKFRTDWNGLHCVRVPCSVTHIMCDI
jgi:hypothetical protein